MRKGQNPLRFQPAPYQFKKVVFLVVTHLPNGDLTYHRDRFDVVKTCLETMRDRAHHDHTFMIWDNDSKDTFREWLQKFVAPDILILSRNIGKSMARASAIQMLPEGSIVCYSDDDIYYYDNWLKPQLEILDHFPNVAAVSGYPTTASFRWGNRRTIEWAKEHATVETGRFIPEEYTRDFASSIGSKWEAIRDEMSNDKETLITYQGRQAYATAHHCQFIGYRDRIIPALNTDTNAMGDERPLDIALDSVGLRLCTTQRYTRHMGNILDESFI